MLIICNDNVDLHFINFDNPVVTGMANLFIHDYHYDEYMQYIYKSYVIHIFK